MFKVTVRITLWTSVEKSVESVNNHLHKWSKNDIQARIKYFNYPKNRTFFTEMMRKNLNIAAIFLRILIKR